MKPLALQLSAFGPFATEQSISFRDLAGQRLFLISGPTGAGKTTILDAICFALYGESSGAEREGSQLRSHFAGATRPTEVKFEFEHHSRTYLVIRRPRQILAKTRGDGQSERPPEASLEDITDRDAAQVLASKARDCTLAIQELLRLTAEQFRQVILIPQDKFRAFLIAPTHQREEVFETLFNTSAYRALQERLRDDARTLEEQTRQLEHTSAALLQSTGCPSLAALDRQIKDLREQQRTYLKQVGQSSSLLEQATAQRELAERLQEQLLRYLRDLRQESDHIREQEALEKTLAELQSQCAQIQSEASQRETLQTQIAHFQTLAPKVEELRQAEALLRQTQHLQAQREQTIQDLTQRHATLLEQQSQLRAELQTATHSQAEQALLQERIATLSQRLQAIRRLQSLQAEENALQPQIQQAEQLQSSAANAQNIAESALANLHQQRHEAAAAILSAQLQPGLPCPVCGSTEHPSQRAVSATPIPGSEAIPRAESQVQASRAAAAQAATKLLALLARQKALQTSIQEAAEDLPQRSETDNEQDLENLKRQLAAARELVESIPRCNQALARTEAALLQSGLSLETSRQELLSARSAQDQASARVATLSESLPFALRDPGRLTCELEQLQDQLQRAVQKEKSAQAQLHQAEQQKTRLQAQLDEARKDAAASLSEYLDTRTRLASILVTALPLDLPPAQPDPAAPMELPLPLVAAFLDHERKAKETHFTTHRLLTVTGATLDTRRQQQAQLNETSKRLEQLAESYRSIGTLAAVANGTNERKLTFQRFVLGVYLDEVLEAATVRLHQMSQGRYELQRSLQLKRAGGLDLEVMDYHTGIARPVATLSGGESFLASLALALGLAEITQAHAGGVRLDAMFIDEGFGSLDAESLDFAFQTLTCLQAQGRLIGIISHVPELKERIQTQLEITPGPQGSSAQLRLG